MAETSSFLRRVQISVNLANEIFDVLALIYIVVSSPLRLATITSFFFPIPVLLPLLGEFGIFLGFASSDLRIAAVDFLQEIVQVLPDLRGRRHLGVATMR